MADRLPMRDVVFLLPGISGSVLQKDGKDIWAPSLEGVWEFVKTAGKSLESLTLSGDDPEAEDLDDGVEATRLVDGIHTLPGLWKVDGYAIIRQKLESRFEIFPSTEYPPGKANYVEFAYDWRRDNRACARRFSGVVERYLGWWRKDQNLPSAKAILLAHSMGGLVARYWLEILEGWKQCHTLVTLGTPHRGSPKAAGFLANGYKPGLAPLTSLVRSCTSVYQLLPIYPMVSSGQSTLRMAELPTIANVDAQQVKEALRFHREIEIAVKQTHEGGTYSLLPVVGTGQPTLQSATFLGSRLTTSLDVPQSFDRLWSHGDGTVPYAAAIPIEMSNEQRLGYICEQHSSIQNNSVVLGYLTQFLARTQSKDLGEIRTVAEGPQSSPQRGLSLEVEDFFEAGEPIKFCVSLVNGDQPMRRVQARIELASDDGESRNYDLLDCGEKWGLELASLPSGMYRVHIRALLADGTSPTAVNGLFEVGD